MQPGWRLLAKTIALTAIVTTAFWFTMAGWWVASHISPDAPLRLEKANTPFEASTAPQPAPSRPAGPDPELIVPVVGIRPQQLVDTFSQARASGARRHDAIDIPAPRGTPVVAAADGRVEKLFLSKDGGNTVFVRSPDGWLLYYYAHLDGYAPGLTEGMALRQGAPVGMVGSTGNADPTQPHLHFAIWTTSPDRKWYEQATAINPYPLLMHRR